MRARENRSNAAARIVLAVVGTLFGLYLVHAAWLERSHEQSRTQALQPQLSDAQREATGHGAYAAQLSDMKTQLAQYRQILPDKFDAQAIETALRDAAKRAGAVIETLNRSEPIVSDFHAEMRTRLVVQGSTEHVLAFVNGLVRDTPIRRLAAMEITPAENGVECRAQLSLVYYRYQDERQ